MCERRRIRKQLREELLFGRSTDEDGVVKKKKKKRLGLGYSDNTKCIEPGSIIFFAGCWDDVKRC